MIINLKKPTRIMLVYEEQDVRFELKPSHNFEHITFEVEGRVLETLIDFGLLANPTEETCDA